MSTHEEQLRTRWHADITRIAAQINDLRAKVDTESRMLYTNLSAEIAALQVELKRLEAEVDAVSPDAYARQIAAQIEELRVKGDAAYDMLHVGLEAQLDVADAEIRRLELAAATATGDARTQILARIDELKSARAAAQLGGYASERAEPGADTSH